MTRCIVNARFLTQPRTGVQQYAFRLAWYLKQHHSDMEFWTPGDIVQTEEANLLGAKKAGRLSGWRWEHWELPRLLKSIGSPLLLNLGNSAPVLYPNQWITLHDMSVLRHPESFSWTFRKYYSWMIPRIVRNCRGIITVSKFSADEIRYFFPDSEKKIEIIYNTCSPLLHSVVKTDRLVCINSSGVRKNLKSLLEAYSQTTTRWKLALRRDKTDIYQDSPHIETEIREDKRIQPMPPLSQNAYQELVASSRFLVNPSLYEGFGLPNLEAMTWGTPLLLADIPVFREICGNAALYAAGENVTDWKKKLQQIIDSAAFREELTGRGLEKSKEYTLEIEGKNLILLLENTRA